MGTHYIIYTGTSEPISLPKSELTPEVDAQIQAMDDLPTTAPINPAPVRNDPLTQPATYSERAGVKTSTPVAGKKYSGGGLTSAVADLSKYSKSLENPVLPVAPDLGAIRTQAEAETATPIYTSAIEGVKSQLRAQEFQKQQIEERRSLDLQALEEDVTRLQDDVRSYDVDPKYFWAGRPLSKSDQEERVYQATREAAKKTTGETTGQLVAMKGATTGDLAKAAVAGAKEIKATRGEAAKEATREAAAVREGGKSNAEKIGLIISSALMSYASGLAGRDPMAGVGMLNSFIDRDIEMQRNELARRSNIAQSKVNFLGEMRDRFRDERAAELQTRAFLKERLAIEMDKVGQKVLDADKKYNLDIMRTKVLQDAQQLTLQSKQAVVSGEQMIAENVSRNQMLQLERDKLKKGKDMGELLVPGTRFSEEKVPTADDAKRVNTTRAQVSDLVYNVKDLIKYVYAPGGVGWQALPTKEAAIANAKLRDIQLMLKSDEFKKLGVLAGVDLPMLEALTGSDATSFMANWNDRGRIMLEQLISRVISNYSSIARQGGYIELELGEPVGFTPSR